MDKVDSMWEHMHDVSRNGNPKKEWEISEFFFISFALKQKVL